MTFHNYNVALPVLQRTEERDLRKARLQEKKEQAQKDAVFKAIKVALFYLKNSI